MMAEKQMISAFASSSNSSFVISSKKYDVFLSFRGEDTRMNFTSHLYESLKQKKVETYIDYRLEKGDEISPALIKAIEDSHVSVVILSKNYASSKWCLEELNKIMECKKNQGQVVIPIFYNIDPSHVRKQTGSYKKAFAKHKGEPRCNKWKAALTEVANLAGWDSRNRTESEFLKNIVGDVLQKLTPRYPNQLEGLVGIEDNYEQIESLLKIGSNEVKTLGIWGMGGIGKTALATAFFAKQSHEFEGGCFLANVREKSDKHGLEALRDKLFSELLENKIHCFDAPILVPHFVMNRLGRKKVFIVLDDVATSEQLEYLIKDYDFLGPGSRVIVTSRNKQIFSQVDEVYKVKELSFHHSLQFFCLTVFGEKQPKLGYEDLSRSAISYCKGIPLALKVLGSNLRSRSKEAWDSELRKLQNIPNTTIHKVLKLSYDGLDNSQKDIFLDIACFFTGEGRDWVTSLLEACEFFAASGIEVLLDKALITISEFNKIKMHDLIQQMGREIVHQESIKDPGRRSRLWKPEEVHEVLKFNRGTDVVEGITLDLCKLTGDLYLSSNSFTKMTNTRFLKIHDSCWPNKFNVYLPNGLESLSYKLRYLEWDGFCLESLPSNFCAEQLVELHMWDSKLKKLWDGVQNLVNLKSIDLWGSQDLVEIPDLSKAEKLESVSLCYCKRLRQLHPSILSLPKLTYLYLSGCREIERLNVHSKSLCELYLRGCSSLKDFSVISEEMTHLVLSDTAICALPPSMFLVPKLTHLDLRGCREIESLNVHSKSLQILYLSGCTSLKEFSVTSKEMTRLDLSYTAISSLPSSIWRNRKLTFLSLWGCNNLDKLSDGPGVGSITAPNHSGCTQHNASSNLSFLQAIPHNIGHLSSLKELDLSGTNIESLPANINNLSLLTKLYLDDCRKLVSLSKLPPSVKVARASNCTSLETDFTQRLVLEHMLQSHIPYIHDNRDFDGGYLIFPGDHVTDECWFRTAESSITIPYLSLSSSDLRGFVYCIILSKGSYLGDVLCSIYQDGRQVSWDRNFILCTNLTDHVLFSYVKTCDLFCNKPFKFEFDYHGLVCDEHHQEESIKQCGVFPVYASAYGLKLFGSSSSKEIFELESIAQISDDESQPRAIGVGGSNNENENEWEQLLHVITSSVFF